MPGVTHRRGFESAHVAHLGLGQWKDWNSLEIVRQQHWILVTNNAIEFRAIYRALNVHPGIIFVLPSVRREQQLVLFEAAVDDMAISPDLTNQALDVDLQAG